MERVIGISFKNKGRIYYFAPGRLNIKKGDNVIVATERGMQYGYAESDIFEIDEKKIKGSLKEVVRIASKEDLDQHNKNIEEANKSLKKCRELVEKYKLKMHIIDANFTFEREQLLFHFLADGRIDFRSLAKDLASIYRTRIELRQVGVRDKAKEIGGLGPCGIQLCCASFLNDFDSVSINMAKNQNIALNPNKINGVCGRLLCCLKYEDECYTDCRKGLPKYGQRVKTPKGEGTVINIELLKRTYKVDVPQVGVVEVSLDDERN